jgi:hypothetical protein
MARFEFGEHKEMSESLGQKIFVAKSKIPSMSLTAYGKTQEEANEHLANAFGKMVETEYKLSIPEP